MGRREGSLVKSAAAWTISQASAARTAFAFRASRPGARGRRAGAERERGRAVPSRRRERPRGAALKNVKEVVTTGLMAADGG